MSDRQIVQAAIQAWEANDEQELRKYLTDDFVLSGPMPEPANQAAFIGLMHAILAALPDWKFNASNLQESGDKVSLTSQITGTQTGQLVIPGLPAVPATGKRVSLPEEHHTYTIREGKIASLYIENTPGGGIPGMLAQLGVALPQG